MRRTRRRLGTVGTAHGERGPPTSQAAAQGSGPTFAGAYSAQAPEVSTQHIPHLMERGGQRTTSAPGPCTLWAHPAVPMGYVSTTHVQLTRTANIHTTKEQCAAMHIPEPAPIERDVPHSCIRQVMPHHRKCEERAVLRGD